MEIRPCGTAALLVECVDLDEVLATYAAVRAAVDDDRVPGVIDVVPAARTVMLSFDPGVTDPGTVGSALGPIEPDRSPAGQSDATEVLELPVTYDGEDLEDVAGILGCTPEEVVRRHTSGLWTVAFCGFVPGFGYLTADEGEWDVPRRDNPRKRVPAGAVGLAGEFTGAYPKESPGGWQLIGRTDAELFDLDRDPPALFTPRRRVRFVDTEER